MTPDVNDTIVAIATARSASERGVVRVAGPGSLKVVESLSGIPLGCKSPQRYAACGLAIEVAGSQRPLTADLFVWPDERSYTRQPAVEVHTVGSPPVLDALVRACVAAGARPAEPGEFTLRALLAGRIDLTQAEAVLAVVDATSDARLAAALQQLAGGLSTPLHRLRADLLGLLADLEAGLDFVEEEDVRFVEPAELRRRFQAALDLVEATATQVSQRDESQRAPRVAIVGPPNVGKSRLFNALVDRYGEESTAPRTLVADVAGVTRDAVAAKVKLAGVTAVLLDTAGDDGTSSAVDAIDSVARGRVAEVRRDADLLIACERADRASSVPMDAVAIATMIDRFREPPPKGWIATSAATGEGLEALATAIAERLAEPAADTLALTADRARSGLAQASAALQRALAAATMGDELVALELREALDGLGRVVGEVVTDEVLGQIFSRFCIGK